MTTIHIQNIAYKLCDFIFVTVIISLYEFTLQSKV